MFDSLDVVAALEWCVLAHVKRKPEVNRGSTRNDFGREMGHAVIGQSLALDFRNPIE